MEENMTTFSRKAALLAATLLSVPAGSAAATETSDVRMTWFGVTNWYYEIGETGILIDGVVSKFNDKEAPSDKALVERVFKALDRGAGVDNIFIGHEHDDHSFDAVAWAQVTGSKIYTSEVACEAAISRGLPKAQCNPVYGGEVIDLDDKTQVHVVRWAHSVGCDITSEGGTKGIETFGFLFTTEVRSGKLSWFISDTGAGGQELVTNRIVKGKDFGSPLGNLAKAMRKAEVDEISLWQGGPESRVVNQARVLVPAFNIKYFMPHHYGARGGYDILGGLHYAYNPAEQPKLDGVLKEYGVANITSINYFDAYTFNLSGVKSIDNAVVKLAMGLPAKGPGPKPQQPNPRAGQLECEVD
ncbi:MBL fold metallo-hydrolase [Neorhizobium petrolearium]|uniref:MBL fold metallo-hydrolase n=1 Tax=Neorhizobium petrolearium TaxID=515361 RepID=UPI003F15A64D